GPLAPRDIRDAFKGPYRNQYSNSTLHVRPQPRAFWPDIPVELVSLGGSWAPCRLLPNICHSDVTGRPNIVNWQPFHCAMHCFVGHHTPSPLRQGVAPFRTQLHAIWFNFRGRFGIKTADHALSSVGTAAPIGIFWSEGGRHIPPQAQAPRMSWTSSGLSTWLNHSARLAARRRPRSSSGSLSWRSRLVTSSRAVRWPRFGRIPRVASSISSSAVSPRGKTSR